MIALCRRIVDTSWFRNGVLAVFVVVNFFIAILLNDLEKVNDEQRAEADARAGDPAARIGALRGQLEEVEVFVRRDRAR